MSDDLTVNDLAIVHQMVRDFIEDMAAAKLGMPENHKLLAYRLEIESKLEEAKELEERWQQR